MVATHASTVEPMSVQNEYGKHKSSQQRCWGCKKEIAGSDQEPLKQPPLCNDCAKSIAKQIEPFVLQALDDKLNLS